MHAAAQYLEGLVVMTVVSLGLGLVAAWGIIRTMFALLDAAHVERTNQGTSSKPFALLGGR